MKKAKRTIITDPIFEVDYLIQRGGTLQEAINKFAKLIHEDSWEVTQLPTHRGHFAAHINHKAGLIWLHPLAGTGLITHEVCHAVSHMLRDLQVKELSKCDEIFAYYAGWLAKEIVRKLY